MCCSSCSRVLQRHTTMSRTFLKSNSLRANRSINDRTSVRCGSNRSDASPRRARATVPGTCPSASVPRRSPRRRDRHGRRRTRCSRSRFRRTHRIHHRSAASRSAPWRQRSPASRRRLRLRHPHRGDVSECVHAGKSRLERPRAHRYIAVFGHSARHDHLRRPVLGNAEEEVIRKLGAVVEHGDAARRIERAHAVAGDKLDVTFGESLEQGARRIR